MVERISAAEFRKGWKKVKGARWGTLEVTTETPFHELLTPKRYYGRVGPEGQLSHEVAWMLADMERRGRLMCLPICASTEHQGGGVQAIQSQALKQHLGCWRGQPDWAFLARDGALVIELKSESGRQSPVQKAAERACRARGVPYVVCRTITEVRRALEDAGMLAPAD